jgi:hypothetical protein
MLLDTASANCERVQMESVTAVMCLCQNMLSAHVLVWISVLDHVFISEAIHVIELSNAREKTLIIIKQ